MPECLVIQPQFCWHVEMDHFVGISFRARAARGHRSNYLRFSHTLPDPCPCSASLRATVYDLHDTPVPYEKARAQHSCCQFLPSTFVIHPIRRELLIHLVFILNSYKFVAIFVSCTYRHGVGRRSWWNWKHHHPITTVGDLFVLLASPFLLFFGRFCVPDDPLKKLSTVHALLRLPLFARLTRTRKPLSSTVVR